MSEKQAQTEWQVRELQSGHQGRSPASAEKKDGRSRFPIRFGGVAGLRKKGIAAAVFVVGTLSGSNHPVFKLFRLAPLLFMLGNNKGDAAPARAAL
jgi:hypothetical protein